MKTGHKNFLLSAVYFLYTANRQTEAKHWFDYLALKYPQAVLDKNKNKFSLEDFAIEQAIGDVGETDVNRTTQFILGCLHRSYDAYAQDEDAIALNFELMAQRVWDRFQREIKGAEIRVGLKPMAELKRMVNEEVFDPQRGVSPEVAARLRAKGITAPTNAPPAVEIKK
jgi:hypothetical protein